MNKKFKIPINWEAVTVGDLALRIHYGYTAKSTRKNTGVQMLRITDIQDYRVNWTNVPFCEIEQDSISKYLLEKGDIVFARTGATVGKSFLIKGIIPQAVFASYLIRIQLSNEILPKYLYYFFQTPHYWRQISSKAKGVGQPNVNATSLSKVNLNLAPLKEQYRIVSKIEELFSDLDNGINKLKIAQNQLKIYRQTLLKSAFDGKLTQQWRTLNEVDSVKKYLKRIKDNRKKRYEQEISDWNDSVKLWKEKGKVGDRPSKPKANREIDDNLKSELLKLPSIPIEWQYSKLGNIGSLERGKSKHRPRNDKRLFGGNYPFIQTSEVRKSNVTIQNFEKTYSEFGLKQSKLWKKGTLCITIAANIAETAFLGFDACFPDSVVGYIPEDNTSDKYVFYFFEYSRRQIEEFAPSTAQKNINLSILDNLYVPICSPQEQVQIVDQLDSMFSIIDHLEQIIDSNLLKSKSLRQSILKKAFEGKLAEPNTKDESATDLLKRIKLEKRKYLEKQQQEKKKAPKKMKKTKTTLLDVIESNFSKESFTYSELKDQCDLSYEEIKTQLFELLEKGENLKSSFNSTMEEIKYSHTP